MESVTLIDPRLCKSYMACKSYGMAWRAGNDLCSGCKGDLSPMRLLHKTIDKHVQPVIHVSRHRDLNEVSQMWVDAMYALRDDLTAKGFEDMSADEATQLAIVRSCLRIAELEAHVARTR